MQTQTMSMMSNSTVNTDSPLSKKSTSNNDNAAVTTDSSDESDNEENMIATPQHDTQFYSSTRY
jgi:hypothetical protein